MVVGKPGHLSAVAIFLKLLKLKKLFIYQSEREFLSFVSFLSLYLYLFLYLYLYIGFMTGFMTGFTTGFMTGFTTGFTTGFICFSKKEKGYEAQTP